MKNALGQYFTPKHIARLMVSQISKDKSSRILEPSAGEGVFLDALYEAGYTNYIGVEIDTNLIQAPQHYVEHASFVTWKPAEKFSVIIGNPPYIRWKHLEKALQDELKTHHFWGTLFNSLSDYLSVFIANSIEHLDDEGELIFITPSFWMHTLHTSALRDWMLAQGSVTEIVDFGESNVFEGVSSSIIIFKFVKGAHPDFINYWKYRGNRKVSDDISLNNASQFEHLPIPSFKQGKHWTLADAQTQAVIEKLERAATKTNDDLLIPTKQVIQLGDFVEIANGMVSGMDKAFRYDGDLEELNQCERNALMRVAKARDLGFLRQISESFYINIPIGIEENEVQERYPHFWIQLNQYSQKLQQRYSYGKELPIWEWAFRRSESFLTSNQAKIFVPCKERMTNRRTARFALVNGGVVATQDVTAIAPLPRTRESIEYILGYLSTIQVSEWIRIRGLMKGGIAEFSEKPLKEIPFRAIDWSDRNEIEFHDRVTNQVRNFLALSEEPDSLINTLSEMFENFS